MPKSTCYAYVQEGIKVLARRALPLTEVVRLAVKAGWSYLLNYVPGWNVTPPVTILFACASRVRRREHRPSRRPPA